MTMTTTTTTPRGVIAHREHARQREAAEATKPGPGWLVGGSERNVSNFPALPDVALVAALLTDESRDAWGAYAERLAELTEARRAVSEALSLLDASEADDAEAAREAVAAKAGTAPPSVRPERADRHARLVRYARAVERLAADDLSALHAALVPERARMLTVAWQLLADEAAKPKRSPGSLLPLVEAVEWTLGLADSPAWPPNGATSRAWRELPWHGWSERVDEALDALAQAVAAELAEDDE
jgi:hypothetical protein